MKWAILFLLSFSTLTQAMDFTPKSPLKDLCQNGREWFITGTTDTEDFNGSSSCPSEWKRDIVVSANSFCEENSKIHSPFFACRVFHNDQLVQDWKLCYSGWTYTATDSCGKYDIEVYATGRKNAQFNNEVESNSSRINVQFWAD